MNETKFNDCFQEYLEYCSNSSWVKDECYKFYFANWLSRKVNLSIQTKETVLRHCKEALKKDYSLDHELSRIGVNFLQKSGREKLSIPIELSDIEIAQYVLTNDLPDEEFFKKRGTSYPALGAWLGTLLPKKFMPIGTSDFHETISHLFDLNNFPRSGYIFFIETQKYFQETKAYLKKHNLDHLYLDNIIQYLNQEYPNVEKKKYEELDWNWITQDFNLFIFRKYLHDYSFKKAEKKNKITSNERNITSGNVQEVATDTVELFSLETYDPPLFDYDSDSETQGNRNLKFGKDHHLKKYQKQLEKGSWAEEIVKQNEIDYLLKCGKTELAAKVEIVSANPDYGYDILSYELDGSEKQIEVKSISSDNPKLFFISSHEMRRRIELSNYYIYCVLSKDKEVLNIYRLKSPDLSNQNIFKVNVTNYEVCFL